MKMKMIPISHYRMKNPENLPSWKLFKPKLKVDFKHCTQTKKMMIENAGKNHYFDDELFRKKSRL